MRSLWIDGQNFADHSAELEKKVRRGAFCCIFFFFGGGEGGGSRRVL